MMSEAVRRRCSMIAAHFASIDDFPSSPLLLPLNCSSSLSSASVIPRRCDNRMYFARQGSCSQASFMRQQQQQVSSEEGNSAGSEAPFFSRPARTEPNTSTAAALLESVKRDDCDLPNFARPNRMSSGRTTHLPTHNRIMNSSEYNAIEGSPRRMDVMETASHYLLTVECPGASIHDIRVEVNDQNLVVKGNRSTSYWKVAWYLTDSISRYRIRDIPHGPFQLVWPLPAAVNKDNVSAQFM
ncbi:uncharacterized protein LOC119992486 [Tripterygium wilfordii]|uniref:uncharacterized protein LOC119992486 n=1 Tax=Tripterygium wilfordii TaxID=458696 RepID=UPI0018F85A31|nr:uncharacterized protein LOC119992486 [Tripterygium wilfordii]